MNYRLYAGYFDDFGTRKGIGVSTEQDVEQLLVDLALFGDPILINDGYLFSNPGLWNLLEREGKEPGSTVLGKLFETRFVMTLARQCDNLANDEKSGKLASALQIMLEHEIWPGGRTEVYWNAQQDGQTNKDRAIELLMKLDKRKLLRSYCWPKANKDAIYKRLWEPAVERYAKDSRLHRQIREHLSAILKDLPQTVSRTVVEQKVINPLQAVNPASTSLLWDLANQAYHMTFAAWLQHDPPAAIGEVLGVASTFPRYFDQFVKYSDTADKPLNVEIPRPSINCKDSSHLHLLERVTTQQDELYEAKIQALSFTRKMQETGSAVRAVDAEDAWKHYANLLWHEFGGNSARTFVRTSSIDASNTTISVSQRSPGGTKEREIGLDLIRSNAAMQHTFGSASPILLQLDHEALDGVINWDSIPRYL